MDNESVKDTIKEYIIPKLDEFIESESAFFLYAEYEEKGQGVKTLIIPAPPMELIEEVMRRVAHEVYEEMHSLPSIIISCERMKYISGINPEEVSWNDIDLMDSGMIIVAMEASTAEGFMSLYKLPSMEEVASKDFDRDSEDAPPYSMTAVTAFMHETLVLHGLARKEENENESKTIVDFKFSRN